MFDMSSSTDDSTECSVCGELVPHSHTVLRSGIGRMCWFCHTDESMDPDVLDGEDFDDYDDYDDWEDWA